MAVSGARTRRGGRGASRRAPREARTLDWAALGRRLGALSLAGLLAVGAAGGVWLLLDEERLPVRHVAVYGKLRHPGRAELGRTAKDYLGRNFFRADIAGLRERLAANPWVNRAEVRRVWPDTLELRLGERRVAGRWGQDELIDTDGQRFRPAVIPGPLRALGRLDGPRGQEGAVLTAYYKAVALLTPLGLRVDSLVQEQRLSWRLTLDNGLDVVFSRDERAEGLFEQELRRFVTVYPEVLAGLRGRVAAVDMRHRNGFAVRWVKPGQT